MCRPFRLPAAVWWVAAIGLSGCATTTVTLNPAPQPPVCDAQADALIVWATRWRPDQKDVAERTAAAATGIQSFFQRSGCFARHEVRYVPDIDETTRATPGAGAFSRVVSIAVRELGPTLQIGSSAGLVEGGTVVVLQVSEHLLGDPPRTRNFTVHWRNGGPGVIKGVATLVDDLQAALAAGLGRSPPSR